MSGSPGIITRAKFISSKSPKYQKAIDYIDRKAATRGKHVEEWHAFSNEQALHIKNTEGRVTTLFDFRQDYMDNQGKSSIKNVFLEAKKKESPMWQTVFSFDNDYLKELGILKDNGQHTLDEAAIREATRMAMSKMASSMNLGTEAEWAAAIHYNTDNIHVHTMLVVRDPENVLKKMTYKGVTQYRGKIPPKTMRDVKSTFANTIENREPELIRISYLMREELSKNIFNQGYSKDIILMRELTLLVNELPKERWSWQYNNKAIGPYRDRIDRITTEIIKQNNSSSFEELSQLLEAQKDFYLRVYGENSPEGNEGQNYKENKLKELNSLTGNALLRELSSLIGREEWKEQNQFTTAQLETFYKERKAHYLTKKNLNKMKYSVQESHQDFLNKLSFERDEYQKEMKRKYELENGRS